MANVARAQSFGAFATLVGRLAGIGVAFGAPQAFDRGDRRRDHRRIRVQRAIADAVLEFSRGRSQVAARIADDEGAERSRGVDDHRGIPGDHLLAAIGQQPHAHGVRRLREYGGVGLVAPRCVSSAITSW